jgi:hypothetical protein
MSLQLITALAALLLAPGLRAQENPSPTTSPEGQEEWIPLDGVAVIVNTDSLTGLNLERHIARRLSRQEVSTEAEKLQLVQQTVDDRIKLLLMRQAGEDLGYDPAMVQARAREIYDEEVEKQGGVSAIGQNSRAGQPSPIERREEIEAELYTSTWRGKIVGRDSGPGGRPLEDRFVRPGTLRRLFRRMEKTGHSIEFLAELGARPPHYELQILFIPGQEFGSLDRARDKALEVRQALGEGTIEWDEALDTLGFLAGRGLTGPLTQRDINYSLDPGNGALLGFVLEGQVGEFSSVLPHPDRNQATGEVRIDGFAIYRLLARQAAEVPGFTASGVQKELGRRVQNQRDGERYEKGLEELKKRAYVWSRGTEAGDRARQAEEEENERRVLEAREKNAEEQRARKAKEAEERGEGGEKPEGKSPVEDAPERKE